MMCQFIHHETFVCPEQNKLESSTSLPGGNLVDGLPPAVGLFSICGAQHSPRVFQNAPYRDLAATTQSWFLKKL